MEPPEKITWTRKCSLFYSKYSVEFNIGAMVLWLIGGTVSGTQSYCCIFRCARRGFAAHLDPQVKSQCALLGVFRPTSRAMSWLL